MGPVGVLECLLTISIAVIFVNSGAQVILCHDSTSSTNQQVSPQQPLLGNQDFTFARNGSFLQIDAGHEWPFSSKREISFRFRTKSPHGLLLYQTFDHNKLQREDDQENLEILPNAPTIEIPLAGDSRTPRIKSSPSDPTTIHTKRQLDANHRIRRHHKSSEQQVTNIIRHLSDRNVAPGGSGSSGAASADDHIRLASSTIMATASEKLVNSLFTSSHISTISGNNPTRDLLVSSQPMSRDKSILVAAGASNSVVNGLSNRDSNARNRILNKIASTLDVDGGSVTVNRIAYESRSTKVESADGSPVLSSSIINSLSASLYELYIKLENGRLKIVYEFGTRLNQTYCGKSLNDDRWHRVDLRVDPEINQMILTLDSVVNVEIVLSQVQHEEESNRRNELVFTNSVLYLGGLNNNTLIVKNVRQRLYLAQFIGCLGQIMLKTDQNIESTLQPAPIDKTNLVKRGCVNLCDTNNYCLHKSTCLNYYTTTKCDCFGTGHEDVYCWQNKLTTLSMLGHSTLVYRIYDWRDRHHSNNNRFSIQFKTLARDSILFFAYGDLSAQQAMKNNPINFSAATSQSNLINLGYPPATLMSGTTITTVNTQANISSLPTIHRPIHAVTSPSNNNYLAISLVNGSLVVEISFGDQPIMLSNVLYDKIRTNQHVTSGELFHGFNRTRRPDYEEHSSSSVPTNLSDGEWHNVTLVHNGKQLSLHLDQHSIQFTITSKNNHLYFDPSIYVGGVPNFLLNETRALMRPINLRHKFVGCIKSVYFNQHNILLDLKQGSQMVEYRDLLGEPLLDSCEVIDTNSLPVTLRSGKSYLTFQLAPGGTNYSPLASLHNIPSSSRLEAPVRASISQLDQQQVINGKKLTWIEFEYKTALERHFLAGGHLRDLSYHDLGGFWTLQAREKCQLYFTISSGLTFDPEQVLVLDAKDKSCKSGLWYKVSISIMSGDKELNITRSLVDGLKQHETQSATTTTPALNESDHGSYLLSSSVELLHQVQLGGDLAKFGELSSMPFSGCLRRININGHLFDSRDFVTTLIASSSSTSSPNSLLTNTANQQQQQQHTQQLQQQLQQQQQQLQQQQTRAQTNYTLNQLLQLTQYDLISSRMAQGYVTIDSCRLVNPCQTMNPCKNGGICRVNEIGEPDCDCSRTGYTGRRCHFSIYKQSCHDLYLSGQRKSSFYLIDLDRNGPLKPVRIRCNMDVASVHQVETSLAHNLPAEYLIRRSSTLDTHLDITYLAFQHMYTHDGFYSHDDTDSFARDQQDLMLRTLIERSLYCKQYFRYECRSAPLNLGNKTWLEAPYPRKHRIASLAPSGVSGQCACSSSLEKKCLDASKSCNCDSGEPVWSDDSHELVGHDRVGITRIVFLKQESDWRRSSSSSPTTNSVQSIESQPAAESQSRITLADLKCYGAKEHGGNQHEITFKTSDAYIEVPGWRRGDISFNFRTASSPPAIVLYQLATSRNHGYFRLTLITDTRLLFEFIVNRRPRRLSLTTSHRLNNGEWQQVFIEYDAVNLRLSVNDDSVLVDLDVNDHLGTFEGPLFIGGAPSKYLTGDLSRRNGFTGCFKGLNINGRSIDLNDYLSASMPTVISGCRPSCTRNLCQNGGKCIEYWGSYECECSNPFAHSGGNCEINLNTNSITFVTQESHYVEQTLDNYTFAPYLIKSILLNIRTYQETALVLYASDQYNNFIQLHKNSSTLVLTFNSNTTIVSAQVPIDDEASSLINNIELSIPFPTTLASTQSPISSERLQLPTSDQASNVSLASRNSSKTNNTMLNVNASNYLPELDKSSIRASNTSGSGQPIQIKIERHRLRTTFYVNNNFVVIEKPLLLLTNYSQFPWINPELEIVRPVARSGKLVVASSSSIKSNSQIFLANINDHYATRLPGFTGCIQGLSIDNQLFDFNRAHLTGELIGEYKIGCKMHCDSFPCKNQGTCVENWIEDKIQCKCDATSYVGRLCDEDIAALFNGKTSKFIYQLSHKLASLKTQSLHIGNSNNLIQKSSISTIDNIAPTNSSLNSTKQQQIASNGKQTSEDLLINFLEIHLAFSSETNRSSIEQRPNVQVLVWITNYNSTRHFFLGLTSDGGLFIQEDYGNSMSLSRLIKRPEQPFNDGHRHMVKYSRFNQTIQIVVDHQTYLPTMSVIASSRMTRHTNSSLIYVGTSSDHKAANSKSVFERETQNIEDEFINYSGCISNLIIKVNGLVIEPLGEAFGQNLETFNVNSNTATSMGKLDSFERQTKSDGLESASRQPYTPSDYTLLETNSRLDSSTRLHGSSDREYIQQGTENIEAIIVRDVEQGKCASFKRVENSNEKRSVNEPRFTQLLDLRPVYMDPPRTKLYQAQNEPRTRMSELHKISSPGLPFYFSLIFLILITVSLTIFAYVLQIKYKTEKFRCETPFFNNKRDELMNTPPKTPTPPINYDEDDDEDGGIQIQSSSSKTFRQNESDDSNSC